VRRGDVQRLEQENLGTADRGTVGGRNDAANRVGRRRLRVGGDRGDRDGGNWREPIEASHGFTLRSARRFSARISVNHLVGSASGPVAECCAIVYHLLWRASTGGTRVAPSGQVRAAVSGQSVKADIAVSILRTAALIDRHFAQVVSRTGVTIQQYNVLRILRGA